MTPKTREIVKPKKPKKSGDEILLKKDWISNYAEIQRIGQRDRAFRLGLRLFSFALASTLCLFLLQGFGLWGFKLPQPLLVSLGGATFCEVAGFTGIVFKFLFK